MSKVDHWRTNSGEKLAWQKKHLLLQTFTIVMYREKIHASKFRKSLLCQPFSTLSIMPQVSCEIVIKKDLWKCQDKYLGHLLTTILSCQDKALFNETANPECKCKLLQLCAPLLKSGQVLFTVHLEYLLEKIFFLIR